MLPIPYMCTHTLTHKNAPILPHQYYFISLTCTLRVGAVSIYSKVNINDNTFVHLQIMLCKMDDELRSDGNPRQACFMTPSHSRLIHFNYTDIQLHSNVLISLEHVFFLPNSLTLRYLMKGTGGLIIVTTEMLKFRAFDQSEIKNMI